MRLTPSKAVPHVPTMGTRTSIEEKGNMVMCSPKCSLSVPLSAGCIRLLEPGNMVEHREQELVPLPVPWKPASMLILARGEQRNIGNKTPEKVKPRECAP
jgi:hypothetical protein